MITEEEYKKNIGLILDSLFLAMRLNEMLYHNKTDRLLRITGAAWERHWRRVKKAKEAGIKELQIPERSL